VGRRVSKHWANGDDPGLRSIAPIIGR
jgi:hypothetical protein